MSVTTSLLINQTEFNDEDDIKMHQIVHKTTNHETKQTS